MILPVHDGATYLPHTLDALSASTLADLELLVAEDGSHDESAAILTARGIQPIVSNPQPRGPFACRNLAAARAKAPVLLFLDADVEVRPDTVERMLKCLDDDPSLDAVIGRYALTHPNPDSVSQFKNAWIHHSYGSRPRDIGWFFTAIGAVRREAFEAVGGFDERFHPRTGGGDVDFGRRLRRHGSTIRLDPSIEVVHRKRFDLAGLLGNDFRRAWGWSRLSLASPERDAAGATAGLANVRGDFVLAVAACGVMLAAALLAGANAGTRPIAGAAAAAATLVWLGANADFLAFVAQRLPPTTALACLPLLWLDQTACGFGIVAALLERVRRRRT